MGGPKKKTYKRSWRNLLLDKSYQLRFTLFMVILSAVLMSLLGWWVMRVAERATTVAVHNVQSVVCKAPEKVATGEGESETSSDVVVDVDGEMALVDPEKGTAAEKPAAEEPAAEEPAEGAAGSGERPEPRIMLGDSEMELLEAPEPVLTAEDKARFEEAKKKHAACTEKQAAQISALHDRKGLIGLVLIATGLLLAIGLFVYGLKMTHRVAGPIFKVGLYLNKLKDNKYDKVYNLRRGDQLVDFYEHFKAAHDGLRRMQEMDVERLREIIEVAEKADLASKSPEIAAALQEMRAVLKKKEESLV